jgi:hypothetical protein
MSLFVTVYAEFGSLQDRIDSVNGKLMCGRSLLQWQWQETLGKKGLASFLTDVS